MAAQTNAAETQETILLNVFCAKEGEAWRVYVLPTWLPRYLHQFFDRHGEAYPALLDFDELDHFMAANGARYEKRLARTGGVELTARGNSASFLAQWLATAFASGLRPATPRTPG